MNYALHSKLPKLASDCEQSVVITTQCQSGRSRFDIDLHLNCVFFCLSIKNILISAMKQNPHVHADRKQIVTSCIINETLLSLWGRDLNRPAIVSSGFALVTVIFTQVL